MKPLPWLVAAVLAYEAYACRTGRTPTVTELVHTVRLHFRPPCRTCGVKPRNPPYRGWHTSSPS